VLARIAGLPLRLHCLRRLEAARVGPIVVATTSLPDDDEIEWEANRHGVLVHRGPVDDVLERFRQVVEVRQEAVVVRATADNPVVDPGSVRRVTAAVAAGADYAVEVGLPRGATVEAIRRTVLLTAADEAIDPYDREHVTPFVRTRPERFALAGLLAPLVVRRPDLSWTVDTPEDLDRVGDLLTLAEAGSRLPSMVELLALADARADGPEVARDVA
jgi:spore coat polysaccharide biosynthesis protein SpsF